MRNIGKLLLTGIFGSAALLAVSCGGGGGGGSVSAQNPKYQGTYTGAATAGDFATFTVSGTELTYKVEGDVFGNKEGTLTLEPWGTSNGLFWKSTDGDVYLGIFNNVGVAYVEDLGDGGEDATVIGLREVSPANDFDFSKTYHFVYVYKNASGEWEVSGGRITFDSNTKQATVTFIDGTTQIYDYEVNATLNSIDLKDSTTGDVEVHIFHKIGNGNVEMFVADFTGGKGFAIGRDNTPVNLDTTKTYTVYYYGFSTNVDDEWQGTAKVYYENGKWYSEWSSIGEYSGVGYFESGKSVLYLNKYCYDSNGDGQIEDSEIVDNDGTACVIGLNADGSEDRSSYGNGIIDLDNQMFIGFGTDSGELLGEIGGW